jgi:hypothetical protein
MLSRGILSESRRLAIFKAHLTERQSDINLVINKNTSVGGACPQSSMGRPRSSYSTRECAQRPNSLAALSVPRDSRKSGEPRDVAGR